MSDTYLLHHIGYSDAELVSRSTTFPTQQRASQHPQRKHVRVNKSTFKGVISSIARGIQSDLTDASHYRQPDPVIAELFSADR